MGDESPRDHHAQIEGVRLHWVELGRPRPGQVPLVLVHGLLDSHRTWRYVAQALAGDRQVLLLDLPGHGWSERPDASYQLAWYARMVATWLALVTPGQVDLVGHSFGGGIAQILLLAYPGRVRRLGLVAAGGLGREIGVALRLASVPFVIEHFGQPFMGIGTRLALWREPGFAREDIAELATMNSQHGSARALARTVRDIIDWRGQRQVFFDRAHEISAMPPVAIFWGQRDRLIPIAHGQRLAAFLPGAIFVTFEGCGHYPHRQQPDRFAREVAEFIAPNDASNNGE